MWPVGFKRLMQTGGFPYTSKVTQIFHINEIFNLIPDSYKLFCVKIKKKKGTVMTENTELLPDVVSVYKWEDMSKNENQKIIWISMWT